MTPYGQTYRPTGQFNALATLYGSLAALVVAVAAAAVVFGWDISGMPMLLGITHVLQGVLIGVVLTRAFHAARLRNPPLAMAIGIFCGTLSAALVHYGHYCYFPYQLRNEIEQKQGHLLPAELHDHPDQLMSAVLKHEGIEQSGWLGYMQLRARIGETISHNGSSPTKITGIGVWILWIVEASFSTLIVAAMAIRASKEPYCEDCDGWFDMPVPTRYSLPPASLPAALAAIKSGDPRQVQALYAMPAFDPARGCTVVALHTCPKCQQSLADVLLRVATGKKMAEKKQLSLLSVSPEMVAALRAGKESPVATAPPALATAAAAAPHPTVTNAVTPSAATLTPPPSLAPAQPQVKRQEPDIGF